MRPRSGRKRRYRARKRVGSTKLHQTSNAASLVRSSAGPRNRARDLQLQVPPGCMNRGARDGTSTLACERLM